MKKMIIGMVIGLMLGMSTNAFAAIGDKVQAVFADFNYVVNGNEKVLDSPVLVYEGTSYVRTTQIANLLGFDVTYKSDSRTIEFNNPNPTPAPTTSPTPTLVPSATPTPELDKTLNSLPGSTAESTPSPVTTPSPTAAPSNVAACQAIRDNYASQIVMVGYETGAEGPKKVKILVLNYERDQQLSAAGC